MGAPLGVAYAYFLLTFQYFLPLVVLIVTYLGIGVKLWTSRMPGGDEKSSSAVENRHKEIVKRVSCKGYLVTWNKKLVLIYSIFA